MSDKQGAVPGITVSDSPHITIAGKGAAMAYFRLCQLRAAVSYEAHGLKHGRWSVTALAKREYGIKGNRAKVLATLEAMIAEAQKRGQETPEGS